MADITSPDGREWFIRSYIIKNDDGTIKSIVELCQDITGRKRAEWALKESEERFLAAFDQAAVGMTHVDLESRFTHVNQKFCDITGYSREELLARSVGEITYAPDMPEENDLIRQLVAGEIDEFSREKRYIRKDGSLVWIYLTATIIREGGVPKYMLGVTQDISERKQVEAALKDSRNQLRMVTENINEVFFMFTPDWQRTVYVSSAYEKIWGRPVDEVYKDARSWMESIAPEDVARMTAFIDGQARGEVAYENAIECRIKKPDGSVRWIRAKTYPVWDEQGNIYRITGIADDITASKDAEDALLASRSMLQLVMDNIPQGIFWKDVDSVYQGCNAVFAKSVGVETPGNIRGKTDYEISYTKKQADWFRKFDRQVITTGQPQYHIIEPFQEASGREGWADTNKIPLRDTKGNVVGVLGTYQDITERKLAEEALRRSEAGLKKSQEIAHLGNWELDLDNNHLSWSDEVYRIYGLQPREFEATYEAFLEAVHPDDRAAVDAAYSGSIREGRDSYEIEHRVVRKSDGEVRIVHEKCEHLRDNSGRIIRSMGMVQDITGRRRVEDEVKEAKAQAELYLDLMGHDINNMHQIALGYLEMARNMHPEAGQDEFLDKPIEVLQRSSRLIRNVRKLQKLRDGLFRTELVDVCRLLVDVQREFGTVPHKQVTLNLNGRERCLVRANELLHDVFANLVCNAIKHTGDSADIVVDLNIVWNKGIQYYRVMVEDNGPGISDDFKGRIFHRMLRGTTNAKGMGLGLYLVKSLVESYSSQVWVEDRVPGDHTKGARFVVMLRAVEQ